MNYRGFIASLIGLQIGISGSCYASDRMDDGLIAYEASCATCHDSGVNGAPRTHEPGDWINRSTLWEAILSEHAKKGFLNMPARGGKDDLPDYDVSAAAEYMLNKAHPDLPQD